MAVKVLFMLKCGAAGAPGLVCKRITGKDGISRNHWVIHDALSIKNEVHSSKSGGNAKVQLTPFARVRNFLSEFVFGKERGALVPDELFIVGELPDSNIVKITQFIPDFSSSDKLQKSELAEGH